MIRLDRYIAELEVPESRGMLLGDPSVPRHPLTQDERKWIAAGGVNAPGPAPYVERDAEAESFMPHH